MHKHHQQILLTALLAATPHSAQESRTSPGIRMNLLISSVSSLLHVRQRSKSTGRKASMAVTRSEACSWALVGSQVRLIHPELAQRPFLNLFVQRLSFNYRSWPPPPCPPNPFHSCHLQPSRSTVLPGLSLKSCILAVWDLLEQVVIHQWPSVGPEAGQMPSLLPFPWLQLMRVGGR